jgi:hypothetical protein
MGWKKKSTTESVDVEIDLDEFDSDSLLQELIDRNKITEAEAEAINARKDFCAARIFLPEPEDIETARHALSRGDKAEALIFIERALGRDFIGRLA